MHSAILPSGETAVHAGVPGATTRFQEAFLRGLPLGRIGNLIVRLARTPAEIEKAQEVRYRVFHEELGAYMGDGIERRDIDSFDAVCDHMLVIDTSLPGDELSRIVGTYRLLREEMALASGGFYSSGEFDLQSLVKRQPGKRFLELGRSCVLPEYRSKRTIEVLWQGIWAYVNHYGIGVMAGCASFHGTVPAAHAEALSFLAHHCRASAEWDVRAVPARHASMDLMPPEALDARSALASMPPLIKGYLRLGAKVGDGCVVDHEFGTTDVFMILPVETISERYINYYGAEAERFQA